jgi:hypothetical protein
MTGAGHVPAPGDLVIVDGHRTGDGRRLGEIEEVVGEGARVHFRVRWEDGRESILYPGTDARIQPARSTR